ncbi:MAG: hypothetical protein AAFR52_14020 [Pseudomonadota bacterium]
MPPSDKGDVATKIVPKTPAPTKSLPPLPKNKKIVPSGKYVDLQNFDMSERIPVELRYKLLYYFSNIEVNKDLGSLICKGVGDMVGAATGVGKGTPAAAGLKVVGATARTAGYTASEMSKIVSEKVATEKTKIDPKTKDGLEKVLEGVRTETVKKLKEKFGGAKGAMPAVENYMGYAKALTKTWASVIASEAGVIGGAFDAVKGATQVGMALRQKIKGAISKHKVDFAEGAIAQIFRMAENAQNWTLLSGTWNIVKGAGGIAMVVSTVGAAWLIKLIVAACEMIVKLVWRIFDAATLQDFCDQARRKFMPMKHNIKLYGLHYDADGFCEWFGQYAIRTPVIGALAANSGYVNQYNLFSLESAKNVGFKDLSAAWKYWQGLQVWLSFYQKEQGIFFDSKNSDVAKRLKTAKDLCKLKTFSTGNVALAMALK